MLISSCDLFHAKIIWKFSTDQIVWSTNFQLFDHFWPVIRFQKCSWTSFSWHQNSIIHTFSLQYWGRPNQDPIIVIFNIERFTHFEHFPNFANVYLVLSMPDFVRVIRMAKNRFQKKGGRPFLVIWPNS